MHDVDELFFRLDDRFHSIAQKPTITQSLNPCFNPETRQSEFDRRCVRLHWHKRSLTDRRVQPRGMRERDDVVVRLFTHDVVRLLEVEGRVDVGDVWRKLRRKVGERRYDLLVQDHPVRLRKWRNHERHGVDPFYDLISRNTVTTK